MDELKRMYVFYPFLECVTVKRQQASGSRIVIYHLQLDDEGEKIHSSRNHIWNFSPGYNPHLFLNINKIISDTIFILFYSKKIHY